MCIYCTSLCLQDRFLNSSNELAQSTSLGPKLMFWVVSLNFVAARDPIRVFIQCVLSREKLRKLVSAAYKARVYASGTVSCFFCNEHAQSTTVGPKLMFRVVSASKTVCCFLATILVFATGRVRRRNGPKHEF